MADATFEVVVAPTAKLAQSGGADAVEFLIGPNPGVPAGPLRETASGGELSRIMLALMSVATGRRIRRPWSSTRSTPGSAAPRRGRWASACEGLRTAARSCASPICRRSHRWRQRHFRVVKREPLRDANAPEVARTEVERLGRSELVEELCRMLGADEGDPGGTPTRREAAPGRVESGLRRAPDSRRSPATRPPALVCIEATTRLPATSGLSPFAALVPEVHGTARLGKRTKHLVRRLTPDDVAIIDHRDLDRMAAEDLVECGVQAVVNVASSTSSRYPNPAR